MQKVKKFSELKSKMSDESQARVKELADEHRKHLPLLYMSSEVGPKEQSENAVKHFFENE